MAQVTMVFRELLVYSQQHETDNDHLVSVATYELFVGGISHGVFESLVRQSPGSSLDEMLEVTTPVGYDGPIDYAALRAAVETYYRQVLGQQGVGIRFGPGTSVTMKDVRLAIPMTQAFEAI